MVFMESVLRAILITVILKYRVFSVLTVYEQRKADELSAQWSQAIAGKSLRVGLAVNSPSNS
jgi:hypothetical protein